MVPPDSSSSNAEEYILVIGKLILTTEIKRQNEKQIFNTIYIYLIIFVICNDEAIDAT